MKILRYLIFFSILSGIFFVIYRQSDEKGFRKWWISFKIAVLIAASAAGLIPANAEAIEPPKNNHNNQVYYERLLSEQEFNLFEDNDGQVILAKADGNPVTPPINRGPSQFPTPPTGGRPSRPVYVPKYWTAPKVVTGVGVGANPAGAGGVGRNAKFDDDQCPAPNKEKSEESSTHYQDFRQKSKKKKKRNEHLNREIEVNGENFEFERYKIEKTEGL